MTQRQVIDVSAIGATLLEALTAALNQLMVAESVPAGEARTGTIRAEASTAAELLPRLTDALTGMAEDFEAFPVDTSIHGLRQLPDAVRVWGTVTLRRARPADPVEVEWMVRPSIEETETGWRIGGRAWVTRSRTSQDP